MCGITGVYNQIHRPPVSEQALLNMLAMIQHRGPDGFGIYRDANVGLGSARLSIIDLSGGDQPISNEDGSLWVVFNGEIFNYVELRPELEARGHHFNTHSDTEIIVHLYEDFGAGCLQHMNGQWAIALWDTNQRSLFLARDRMGIRPLFYTVRDGQLIFGSEIKSILAYDGVQAELDPDALREVFTFWSVQQPRSIFKGIYELPPGHYLQAVNGRIVIQPYWQPDFSIDETPRSTQSYQDELEALLIDATRIRLRADVPVGAYLSGGLDSSLTTAMIRSYTNNRLDTFSIAFSDENFDESSYQRMMAATLGTDHHEVYCTHSDIGEIFPQVIWHTETPVLRTAPAPMFLLSGLVHQHGFKVVMTGEGADEMLAGYDIFKEMKIRRFWARNPESELRPRLLERLYPDVKGLAGSSGAYLKAFFRKDLTNTTDPYYSHQIRWSNTARNLRFLTQPLDETEPAQPLGMKLPAGFGGWSALGQAQYLEAATFLSPYLLSSQGDRMAMGHSVEGRYPFLDVRVVEFCNRLPPNVKMNVLTEKYLLKMLGRKYLPDTVWQRVKRPYRAPIHRSFFSKPLDYAQELLCEKALRDAGYFEPEAVRRLVAKASAGGRLSEMDDMALVGILSTQLVDHQFVKNFPVSPAVTALATLPVVRKRVDRLAVL